MGRPAKYASDAERQAAMRDRWHVTSIRLEKSLGETMARLASKFDVSFSEAVAQVLKFGLTNRNWDTLGFGFSRPQRPNNTSEGLMAKKSAADYPIAKVARKNPARKKAAPKRIEPRTVYQVQYSKDGKTWRPWTTVDYDAMAVHIAKSLHGDPAHKGHFIRVESVPDVGFGYAEK